MTERLTVEMVDELAAREDHEDGSDRYYDLLQTVTSPALIRAALVERDDALAEAQARIDALVAERDNALEVVEAASKESAK